MKPWTDTEKIAQLENRCSYLSKQLAKTHYDDLYALTELKSKQKYLLAVIERIDDLCAQGNKKDQEEVLKTIHQLTTDLLIAEMR